MSQLQDLCTKIKIEINKNWEYDERFVTFLAVVDNDEAPVYLDKLTDIFHSRYDATSIKKSDKKDKKLAKDLFGLKNGQFLFTSYDGKECIYGAWWPWGDNSKVSIRIGLYNNGPKDEIIKIFLNENSTPCT